MSVECALCKKALGISKHHRHFSSVEVRLSAKGRYYCESCKGEHWPTDIGPRHKLHVTSSMLHRYWANTPGGSAGMSTMCQFVGDQSPS